MEGEYSEYAAALCDAIRTMASHPDRIDNFESYLSYCFADWMKDHADTPEGLANEFQTFATMDISVQ